MADSSLPRPSAPPRPPDALSVLVAGQARRRPSRPWFLTTMRGQTSIEFLILLGFMLIVFTSFFVVAQDVVVENNQREIRYGLITVANGIRDEILTANQVHPGYSRVFTLPKEIHDTPYTAQILDSTELVLIADSYEYIIFLPIQVSIDGDSEGPLLIGGENTITTDGSGVIAITT